MTRILLEPSSRRGYVLPVAIFLAVSIGCDAPGHNRPGETQQVMPPLPAAISADGLDRTQSLGLFLASYWELPVPSQGPAPSDRPAVENSLAPQACAACHPKQHEQWNTSLHAKAFSPGFSGQLIEGDFAEPLQLRQCQTCHAPLAEQQPYDENEAINPEFDAALREQGIVCAGCHVRSYRRFGPPRRADLEQVDASATAIPHNGFEARNEFTESRFCAQCHQFFDDPGVNGKPIQNTYVEWQASPAAAEGKTCQSCHMPDRAHLWRGIHDPDMVSQAVDVELSNLRLSDGHVYSELSLHSRAVGHALPTYVTPRLFLAVWQEDGGGREIAGTRREDVVGREIDFELWQDVFDTRIPPGGTRILHYDVVSQSAAAALVGQVRVEPDYYYRGVFEYLLDSYQSPDALARVEEAHRESHDSIYVLAELRRPLVRESKRDDQ